MMDPGELIERYGPRVRKYLQRRMRPADAEDLWHTTVVKVLRDLKKGTVPLNPEAWIMTIARNEMFQAARSSNSWRHCDGEQLFPFMAHPAPPVDSALNQRETLAVLLGIVNTFPQRARSILYRIYWLGDDEKEVSASLGLCANTVKTIRHRSLNKLRLAAQQRMARPTASLPCR